MFHSKTLQVEIKSDPDRRLITAYASTFGNVDHDDDVAVPGCYSKTIKDDLGSIKVLWQHREPLGKPVEMVEDKYGLLTVSKMAKTQLGDEALELAREGIVDKMSIGYCVTDYHMVGKDSDIGEVMALLDARGLPKESGMSLMHKDDSTKFFFDGSDKIRLMLEVKLKEYSLVTFPANDMAVVLDVKSFAESHNLSNDPEFAHLMKRCGINLSDGVGLVEASDMKGLIDSISDNVIKVLDDRANNDTLASQKQTLGGLRAITTDITQFITKRGH